jgi:SAM-dependent methyltransferase
VAGTDEQREPNRRRWGLAALAAGLPLVVVAALGFWTRALLREHDPWRVVPNFIRMYPTLDRLSDAETYRAAQDLLPRLFVFAALVVLFVAGAVLFVVRARRPVLAPAPPPKHAAFSLFLISFLILFIELAAIRFFPAYVVFLTFFSNFVLIAAFLGMSVGCLAAQRRANLVHVAPPLLFFATAASGVIYLVVNRLRAFVVEIGRVRNPEQVFFGTTYQDLEPNRAGVPVELVLGVFFVLIALIFVGLGQELGRGLNRFPNRIKAYAINLAGSLVGILGFTLMSYLSLPPVWWFLVSFAGLMWFLRSPLPGDRNMGSDPNETTSRGLTPFFRPPRWWAALQGGFLGLTLAAVVLMEWCFGGPAPAEVAWSPYYNIRYYPPPAMNRTIVVNTIGHQEMIDRTRSGVAYSLPYLLNRDSGGAPIRDVLIIGAGSGNDAAHALWHGAERVDAVEIDPLIADLGRRRHPNRPYQDPRVNLIIADGRNVLKNAPRQYDLIVYALVDSLTLHSYYSSVRLESFLFTREALEDIKARLKPDGIFVAYNYFREGWIVTRLSHMLTEVFGGPPVVLRLSAGAGKVDYDRISDRQEYRGQAALFAGHIDGLRRAFADHPGYTLDTEALETNLEHNGFTRQAAAEDAAYETLRPAEIMAAAPTVVPTDDWPFFYLKDRRIPKHNLTGLALVLVLSLLILAAFAPVRSVRFNPHFLFLGAGFMLVETNSIIRLALLFGSTWRINSVVFFTILVMSLLASLYVILRKPTRMRWYYVALGATLALNLFVDLGRLLALAGTLRLVVSCVLVFLPMLFAGIIFSSSFRRSANPDVDFGANVAGVVLGGVLEYLSLITGYRLVLVTVMALYALSLIGLRRLRGAAAPV